MNPKGKKGNEKWLTVRVSWSIFLFTGIVTFMFVASYVFSPEVAQAQWSPPDQQASGGSARLIIEREPNTGGWQPVTGARRTVWVSERISLRARMSNGAAITSASWDVPGDAFGNYQPTTTSGHPTPIGPTNLTKIAFKWRDRGDGMNVNFTGTSEGRTYTGRVTFSVNKPICTLTIARDTVWWYDALRFGYAPPHLPGIAFHSNRTGNWPTAYDIQWVQVVRGTERRLTHVTPNFNWVRWQPNVAGGAFPWLDTSYPYTQANEPIYGSPNAHFATSDWPSVGPAFSDTDEIRVTDSFTMYLMFKTRNDTSRWITLRKVDWYWNGRAVLNSTNGVWSIPTSDHSDGGNQESTSFPQWEGSVVNGSYVPV